MVFSQINAFPEDIGIQAHKLPLSRNELRETAYELYMIFFVDLIAGMITNTIVLTACVSVSPGAFGLEEAYYQKNIGIMIGNNLKISGCYRYDFCLQGESGYDFSINAAAIL